MGNYYKNLENKQEIKKQGCEDPKKIKADTGWDMLGLIVTFQRLVSGRWQRPGTPQSVDPRISVGPDVLGRVKEKTKSLELKKYH